MDNACPHLLAIRECTLKNVKIILLPPNTTSQLQPLDCGIIANIKAKYRRKHIYSLYTNQNPTWKPDLYDSMLLIVMAWSEVTPTTIQNCWIKSQLIENSDRDFNVLMDDQMNEISFFRNHYLDLNSLLKFDDNCETSEEFTNIDLKNFISDYDEKFRTERKNEENETENISSDSDSIENNPSLNINSAIKALEHLLVFLPTLNIESADILSLAKIREKLIIKKLK